jgi:hypothetical protein
LKVVSSTSSEVANPSKIISNTRLKACCIILSRGDAIASGLVSLGLFDLGI